MKARRDTGRRGHVMTEDMIDYAAQMYRLGAPLRTVGAHFGVSPQAIYYHLRERVTMRRRGTRETL